MDVHQVVFFREYMLGLMTENVRSCNNHNSQKLYLETIGLVTLEGPEFAKIICLLVSSSLPLVDAEKKHSLKDVLGNELNKNFREFLVGKVRFS